jgi:hypothetical protein
LNSWYENEPKGTLVNAKQCYLNKNAIINFREKGPASSLIMVGDTLALKFTSSLVAR